MEIVTTKDYTKIINKTKDELKDYMKNLFDTYLIDTEDIRKVIDSSISLQNNVGYFKQSLEEVNTSLNLLLDTVQAHYTPAIQIDKSFDEEKLQQMVKENNNLLRNILGSLYSVSRTLKSLNSSCDISKNIVVLKYAHLKSVTFNESCSYEVLQSSLFHKAGKYTYINKKWVMINEKP